MTSTPKPRPLIGYAKTIHDLDPTINPVGVEESMRIQYGTLDHLDRATFRAEIRLAHDMEAEEPGILRRIADSYGNADRYDEAEAHVSRLHRPDAPTIHRPAQLILA